eukprot:Hpha_TRINITY_DN17905_c0_g1::TRINITY_DN17905_c0_g1_i1::g.33691::m.33691
MVPSPHFKRQSTTRQAEWGPPPGLYGPYPALSDALHTTRAHPWPRLAGEWNSRWQQAWDRECTGPANAMQRAGELGEVASDFATHCGAVAKQLVDETSVAARAGEALGYLHHDHPSIYFTQGVVASQVAPDDTRPASELRALGEFVGAQLLRKHSMVSIPLACSVRYKGLRLWCHAPLPWGCPDRSGGRPSLSVSPWRTAGPPFPGGDPDTAHVANHPNLARREDDLL